MRIRPGSCLILAAAICVHGKADTSNQAGRRAAAPADSIAIAAPFSQLALDSASSQLDSVRAAEAAERVQMADGIDSLMASTLSPEVDAEGLFDVDLSDESGLRVERARLRAVLAAWPTEVEGGGGKKSRKKKSSRQVIDSPADSLAEGDTLRFQARLLLDKARIRFYDLPKTRRDSLLASHAETRRLAKERSAALKLSEAETRAQEAEQEKQRLMALAHEAHSEAERLVAEERARLFSIAGAQAEYEAELVRGRQALKERAEKTLKLRRMVREVSQGTATASANNVYDELKTYLRASRGELSSAISLAFAPSGIPAPGPNPLREFALDTGLTAVDSARTALLSAAERLAKEETAYRSERCSQLYEEIKLLNADRLVLLELLTAAKRSAILGFTLTGLDQAIAELRQVTLILRYHVQVIREWMDSSRYADASRGKSAVLAGWILAKWLFLILVFYWWQRRGSGLITDLRLRLREEDKRARAVQPNPLYLALGFFQQVRQPLEWLVFIWGLVWLLPESARGQLEVVLLQTVFQWTLFGSLAVRIINTLASGQMRRITGKTFLDAGGIRLKSLKLIGRTVVVLGLILVVSAKWVGKGTVYSWVVSVCWMAVIPVVLVIVRWWRPIIFERVAAIRKKRDFENWVIANQTGWKSLLAALAAGSYLFVKGGARILREWLSGFDLTRKGLAFLFRRELDRIAEEKGHITFRPLPHDLFQSLGPETASEENISGSAEDEVARVTERIHQSRGGVFAVVGERGAGKTRVLRRVRNTIPHVVLINCDENGLEGLRAALADGMNLDASATLEQCAIALNGGSEDAAIIIDGAHRLIRPFMGGLADFDRLVTLARAHCTACSWFFSLDDVVWRFFCRAREESLLFDDVIELEAWRSDEIVNLLTSRSRQAGLRPGFQYLLEKLPADADEIDRAEALERAAAGYYRMLWDASAGNPGIALHLWRCSLGLDPKGEISVKLFQVPESQLLDQLPDSAVFVLRAVIQLEPALPEEVARTTMQSLTQVQDTLRYGLSRGYFEKQGRRYRVTWVWFRTITRFLQRRHLLAT